MSRTKDWSDYVIPKLRGIVAKASCPTCGVRAGMPCRNPAASLGQLDANGEPLKRPRREWYRHSVHAARRTLAKTGEVVVPPRILRREMEREMSE